MSGTHAYHVPSGNPCGCGASFLSHKVDHKSDGDPCSRCGLPERNHRKRDRIRAPRESRYRPESSRGRVYHDSNGDPCSKCGRPAEKHRGGDKTRLNYIGIDGEGIGGRGIGAKGPDRDHRYILLAAASTNGEEWFIAPKNEKRERLTTAECLDFILTLPTRHNKIFSFSFNYDLTKMLMDLDNESLWYLFRPEKRPRSGRKKILGPAPVLWPKSPGMAWNESDAPNPYILNLQGTKFTVQRDGKRVVVWDLFKFFQSKFVSALEDWKVGNKEVWDRLKGMKDKRNVFDSEVKEGKITFQDIKRYCMEECLCMAQLGKALIEAHDKAGLELRSYYGAGSSGGAMLSAMGIKERIVPCESKMLIPVFTAFSGGRFENSVIGAIKEHLVNYDISSAYPYQLTFLPCLEHGSWTHTRNRNDIEKAENQSGALVRYRLRQPERYAQKSWGPFPFRERDGSICYPIESGGGWVWRQEYLAGERLFPNVEFVEAWVYSSNCDCKPFAQMPEYYCLRCKIGKEGPGIVIKLACNSCYGKLAQSIGSAVYNSWIWAGMITSGCRAQLLELLGCHDDFSDVLMMATDGLLTRNLKIVTPTPLPTGTAHTGKPLGGWERKDAERGMFLARPGIYFPMNPSEEEIQKIRARGVGRSVVMRSWRVITEAWKREGINGVARIAEVGRFCGAKTSVSRSKKGFNRASAAFDSKLGTYVEPHYGQWTSRPVEMTFHPKPKRERLNKDGRTLELRRFPQNLVSEPYDAAVKSHEAKEMMAAKQEIMEQPNGDLNEYDIDEIRY